MYKEVPEYIYDSRWLVLISDFWLDSWQQYSAPLKEKQKQTRVGVVAGRKNLQVDLLGTRGSRACEARRGCDQCWSNQSVCLCSPLETDLAMDQSVCLFSTSGNYPGVMCVSLDCHCPWPVTTESTACQIPKAYQLHCSGSSMHGASKIQVR